MTNLADVMASLIEVFHSYSQREGDKYTLTKGELKTLLQEELGDCLSTSNDSAAVDEIMSELDVNQDGVVDFREFLLMFGVLIIACHDFFKGYSRSCEEQDGNHPCADGGAAE